MLNARHSTRQGRADRGAAPAAFARRALLLVAVAAIVVALVATAVAAAATLGVSGATVGAGSTTVASCQSGSFTFPGRIVDGTASHNVTSLSVGNISAACAGGTLYVTLTNAANASLGSGTVSNIAAGAVTVPISNGGAAANVTAYRVAVTLP
jgi:hypothetical protein